MAGIEIAENQQNGKRALGKRHEMHRTNPVIADKY